MGGMRTQITARRAHAVRGLRVAVRCLFAVAALSLAACGGDEESPAAAAADGPDASTRQAMADFAECMRENGIDFPDPGSGERGRAVRIEGSPEKMRKAEEACAEYREKIRPPELSEEQRGGFKEAALAHARCMREHGIENFPDPQFDADGGAAIQFGPGAGIDFEDPDFKAAQEECQGELPQMRGESAP
jgi:hypothetical protein